LRKALAGAWIASTFLSVNMEAADEPAESHPEVAAAEAAIHARFAARNPLVAALMHDRTEQALQLIADSSGEEARAAKCCGSFTPLLAAVLADNGRAVAALAALGVDLEAKVPPTFSWQASLCIPANVPCSSQPTRAALALRLVVANGQRTPAHRHSVQISRVPQPFS